MKNTFLAALTACCLLLCSSFSVLAQFQVDYTLMCPSQEEINYCAEVVFTIMSDETCEAGFEYHNITTNEKDTLFLDENNVGVIIKQSEIQNEYWVKFTNLCNQAVDSVSVDMFSCIPFGQYNQVDLGEKDSDYVFNIYDVLEDLYMYQINEGEKFYSNYWLTCDTCRGMKEIPQADSLKNYVVSPFWAQKTTGCTICSDYHIVHIEENGDVWFSIDPDMEYVAENNVKLFLDFISTVDDDAFISLQINLLLNENPVQTVPAYQVIDYTPCKEMLGWEEEEEQTSENFNFTVLYSYNFEDDYSSFLYLGTTDFSISVEGGCTEGYLWINHNENIQDTIYASGGVFNFTHTLCISHDSIAHFSLENLCTGEVKEYSKTMNICSEDCWKDQPSNGYVDIPVQNFPFSFDAKLLLEDFYAQALQKLPTVYTAPDIVCAECKNLSIVQDINSYELVNAELSPQIETNMTWTPAGEVFVDNYYYDSIPLTLFFQNAQNQTLRIGVFLYSNDNNSDIQYFPQNNIYCIKQVVFSAEAQPLCVNGAMDSLHINITGGCEEGYTIHELLTGKTYTATPTGEEQFEAQFSYLYDVYSVQIVNNCTQESKYIYCDAYCEPQAHYINFNYPCSLGGDKKAVFIEYLESFVQQQLAENPPFLDLKCDDTEGAKSFTLDSLWLSDSNEWSLLHDALMVSSQIPAVWESNIGEFPVYVVLNFTPTSYNTPACDFPCYFSDLPPQSQQLLVDFYNSTNGSSWTNNAAWLEFHTPLQEWYGLNANCNGISSINLPNNNLTGTLPNNFNTWAVGELFLDNNQIGGNLPAALGNTPFSSLNLSYNQFSGSISQMPNAFYLVDLSHNQFSGSISQIPYAFDVNLSYNQFSGSIPSFTDYSNNSTVNLSHNQFSGQIPDLVSVPDLKVFDVSYNQLSGQIPDLVYAPNLYAFDVSYNQLNGQIPDFSYLPDMLFIDASHNQLVGQIPTFSYDYPDSEYHSFSLDVSYNQLSGGLPLSYFGALNASHNQLSGDLSGLIDNQFGSSLNISHNQFSGALPHINFMNSWSYLDVSFNHLSGSLPSLEWYQRLNLSHNNFSGTITDLGMGNELNLSYNNLSGAFPDLSGNAYLSEIDVSHNNLSGTLPDISNAESLRIVKICPGNSFYGDIPVFDNCPDLDPVDFSCVTPEPDSGSVSIIDDIVINGSGGIGNIIIGGSGSLGGTNWATSDKDGNGKKENTDAQKANVMYALQISPNPVQNYLHITAPAPEATVRVWTITGKLLLTHSSFISGDAIDMSAFPQGSYIIEWYQAAVGRYFSKCIKI